MKKYFLLIILIAAACSGLHAQEFKKSQSVTDQFKNNSVAGMKYDRNGNTAPAAKKNSTSAQQAQLPSNASAATSEAAKPRVAPVITGQGDITYEQAEAQTKKQTVAPAKTAPLPTQEEKAKEEKPKEEKKQQ